MHLRPAWTTYQTLQPNKQNEKDGAKEMALWIKHLLYTNEDLNLSLQDLCKDGQGISVWNPSFPWEIGGGDRRSLEGRGQASLLYAS